MHKGCPKSAQKEVTAMTVYAIIYDFSNDYTDERNISERFEGSWQELQEYIKQMKENGCYNIEATAICGAEDYDI